MTVRFDRPDTVMGRALATRALALAAQQQQHRAVVPPAGLLDLTVPAMLPLPEHVRQAAKDALDRGETHYTSRPGVPALRRAIAERSTAQGFSAVTDSTVVTNGGAEALYIALQAVLTANSTALVVEPVSPQLIEMITFIGARIERVVLSTPEHCLSAVETIEQSLANVLVIASPSLISGRAIASPQLQRLVAAAIERGMEVILDRSGVPCLFESDEQPFPVELGARVITIGSFSAGYGLHGWRVGFLTAPADRVRKVRGLKQAMSICTTAVSQFAALAALQEPTDWLEVRRAFFRSRLNDAAQLLQTSPFAIVPPDAYPSVLLDVRAITGDDRAVVAHLASNCGVVVEPGSRFGGSTTGYIRFELGVEETVFRTGLTRLAAVRNGEIHA